MRRARGIDVMFLVGETSAWHMHVCGVAVLDPTTAPGGFDPARLPDFLSERLALAPQFRWKLRTVPFGLDRPLFVEATDFDISRHFYRAALPAPGGREELGELVGDIASRKLPHDRPLWEVWTIEGLAGGLVAVLTKISHALIDGSSGTDLAGMMMDVSPEPRLLTLPRPTAPERAPATIELLARGTVATLATPLRAARYGEQLVRQSALMGRRMLGHTRAGLPFQAPTTSFNRRLSPYRSFAYAEVPLAEVRRVKDAFGVKVNDVVLALVAGALRRYLDDRNELPRRPLIAEVPVSLRTEATRTQVGTLVGTMFASLATHLADPVERLMAIKESTAGAKEMEQAFVASRTMSLAEVPPPAVISLFTRLYSASGLEGRVPPIFNLIVSSVPGPPFDLYLAGARVVATYPLGPLLYGSGLNATVVSYGDKMDFGFLACREQVRNLWLVADAIAPSLAELSKAAGRRRARPRGRSVARGGTEAAGPARHRRAAG